VRVEIHQHQVFDARVQTGDATGDDRALAAQDERTRTCGDRAANGFAQSHARVPRRADPLLARDERDPYLFGGSRQWSNDAGKGARGLGHPREVRRRRDAGLDEVPGFRHVRRIVVKAAERENARQAGLGTRTLLDGDAERRREHDDRKTDDRDRSQRNASESAPDEHQDATDQRDGREEERQSDRHARSACTQRAGAAAASREPVMARAIAPKPRRQARNSKSPPTIGITLTSTRMTTPTTSAMGRSVARFTRARSQRPMATAATGKLIAITTRYSASATKPIHHPPMNAPTMKARMAKIGMPISNATPIPTLAHGFTASASLVRRMNPGTRSRSSKPRMSRPARPRSTSIAVVVGAGVVGWAFRGSRRSDLPRTTAPGARTASFWLP